MTELTKEYLERQAATTGALRWRQGVARVLEQEWLVLERTVEGMPPTRRWREWRPVPEVSEEG
jgi:hypothetical protein